VGAVFEHYQFALVDAALHHVREAGSGDEIVPAEGDLGRRLDLGELSCGIVGDDRLGLLQEGGKRLGRSAAHEGRECLDMLGPCGIELGREAPGKDALDDHLGYAAKALGH
jgi:hypothetical protein